MKKNKGFTLIELLAIIVILAIIAVITVPIILEIIENSRRGAATDSAYGYKDAINKWYVSNLSDNQNETLNGTYTIEDGRLDGIEIPLSGDKPTNGTLTYSNNVLTKGCLTIGEYKVTFKTDGTTNTEKGECPGNEYLYIADSSITLFPDMYLAIYDESQDSFVKTNEKLQLSHGTTTRPTNKNIYLRFTLENGELPDEAYPEICIFEGKEICFNNNEYEGNNGTKQKILDYFGYTKEGTNKWTPQDDDWWERPDQTAQCQINNSTVNCDTNDIDLTVTLEISAFPDGTVYVYDYSKGTFCAIKDGTYNVSECSYTSETTDPIDDPIDEPYYDPNGK